MNQLNIHSVFIGLNDDDNDTLRGMFVKFNLPKSEAFMSENHSHLFDFFSSVDGGNRSKVEK